jgi:hypothetical protein
LGAVQRGSLHSTRTLDKVRLQFTFNNEEMKKSLYLFLALGMFTFASCDSREENRQERMEDRAEDAADDMEDAADDAGDEVEDAVN